MSGTIISVTEAVRDFARVLERVENGRETAILMREGKKVAQIVPCPAGLPSPDCEEMIRRWQNLDRLPPDEAEAFARDVEAIHARQPPLKSVWD